MRNSNIMALALMFSTMDHYTPIGSRRREIEITKRSIKTPEEVNKKLGLKEFIYGETKIWALNQKNADKKAKKLGLIT